MRLSVTSNVKDVSREWKRLAKAYKTTVKSGLNKAAFKVAKEDMPKIMEEGIDRPARFTKSKGAARYRKATEQRLISEVYVSPIQADYLQKIVFGGRGDKGKAVPVNIRLNKFGNIANLKDAKKIEALLAKPGYFAKTINGVPGIWRKVGKRIQMVIYFSQGDYKYRKQFDWHKGVIKYANKRLPEAMNDAINRTLSKFASRGRV